LAADRVERGLGHNLQALGRRHAPDVERLSATTQLELRQLQKGYRSSVSALGCAIGIQRSGHLVGKENLAAARAAAQTRRDIDRVAHERLSFTPWRSECAERDIAQVHANADAGLDRQFALPASGNGREVLEYGEPGGERLARTAFARSAHAKSGHHAVAGHVIDVSTMQFGGAHEYAIELNQQCYDLSR